MTLRPLQYTSCSAGNAVYIGHQPTERADEACAFTANKALARDTTTASANSESIRRPPHRMTSVTLVVRRRDSAGRRSSSYQREARNHSLASCRAVVPTGGKCSVFPKRCCFRAHQRKADEAPWECYFSLSGQRDYQSKYRGSDKETNSICRSNREEKWTRAGHAMRRTDKQWGHRCNEITIENRD